MFGLENKEKSTKDLLHDFEKNMSCSKKRSELIARAESRIGLIKKKILSGVSKDEFFHLSVLEKGYLSLIHVIKKFTKPT